MVKRHLYRFGLLGMASSGKTSLLTALSSQRPAHQERAVASLVMDEKQWDVAADRVRFPEAFKAALKLGRHNMSTHKKNLADGSAPKPDDLAPNDDLLVYPRYLFAGTASGIGRGKQYDFDFTLFDYSGKNLKPSLFQPAPDDPDLKTSHDISSYLLQQHFIDCDGVVVVAPLMGLTDSSIHMARLAESVSALVEAHKSTRRNEQLGGTPLPLAIAISKADELDVIAMSTEPSANLQARLQHWLKADPRAEPYRRLISASEELVGSSNVHVFAVSALGATEICEIVYKEDRVKNRDAAGSASAERRFERYYRTKQSVEARTPHRMAYVDRGGRSTAATSFDPGSHTVILSDGTQVTFDAKDRGSDSEWLDAKAHVESASDGELRLLSFGVDDPFPWLAARYDELVAESICGSLGRIRARNLHLALGSEMGTQEKWQIADAIAIAGELQVRSAPRTAIETAVAVAKRRRGLRAITTSAIGAATLLLGAVSAEHASMLAHQQAIELSMARPIEGRVLVEDRKADLAKLEALSSAPEWRYLIHRHVMPSTPALEQRIAAAKRLVTEETAVTKLVNERLRYVDDLKQKLRSPTLTLATVCRELKAAQEKSSWLSTAPRPVKPEVWQEISNAFVRVGEDRARRIRETNFSRINQDIEAITPGTIAACTTDDEVRKAVDKPLEELRRQLINEHRSMLEGQNDYCASLAQLESNAAKELSPIETKDRKLKTTTEAQKKISEIVSTFLKALQEIGTEQKARNATEEARRILALLDGPTLGCYSTNNDPAARKEWLDARNTVNVSTAEALYREYSARADEYYRDPKNMLKVEPRAHLTFLADALAEFAKLAEFKDNRVDQVKSHVACVRLSMPVEVVLTRVVYSGKWWTRSRPGYIFIQWSQAQSGEIAKHDFIGGDGYIEGWADLQPLVIDLKVSAKLRLDERLNLRLQAASLPREQALNIPELAHDLSKLFATAERETAASSTLIAKHSLYRDWGTGDNKVSYVTRADFEFRLKPCLQKLSSTPQ